MTNHKLYTVESANSALVLVRPIVKDIVRQYAEIKDRRERLDAVRPKHSKRAGDELYTDEVAQMEQELERDVAVLESYIQELVDLGIELKDLDRGLIDFYSLMDGREVFLCWLLGEDEITHWHELDAGFAGRQSLLETSPLD